MTTLTHIYQSSSLDSGRTGGGAVYAIYFIMKQECTLLISFLLGLLYILPGVLLSVHSLRCFPVQHPSFLFLGVPLCHHVFPGTPLCTTHSLLHSINFITKLFIFRLHPHLVLDNERHTNARTNARTRPFRLSTPTTSSLLISHDAIMPTILHLPSLPACSRLYPLSIIIQSPSVRYLHYLRLVLANRSHT